jgi:hypothetical protein
VIQHGHGMVEFKFGAKIGTNDVYCRTHKSGPGLSYPAFGGLLAGEPGGRAALSITPYMNQAGYCRQRNYCSKFTLL